jgi:hypothetical protein
MPMTTEQALRQQQQDAERDRRPVPTRPAVPAPPTADDRAARNRYLEEIGGACLAD